MRIGIVPMEQGTSDAVKVDDMKNLIVCPLPYDNSFMELFYRAWIIVKTFIKADAQMPKEVMLPVPSDRFVCDELVKRREFQIVDVIEALDIFSQPHLLKKEDEDINLYETDAVEINDLRKENFAISSTIAPEPMTKTI